MFVLSGWTGASGREAQREERKIRGLKQRTIESRKTIPSALSIISRERTSRVISVEDGFSSQVPLSVSSSHSDPEIRDDFKRFPLSFLGIPPPFIRI